MNRKDLANAGQAYYKELLSQIKLQRHVAFHVASEIEHTGVYFVYQSDILLYVDIAKQSLKLSLQQMASSYMEHPLNRKLLLRLIVKTQGKEIPSLKKTGKNGLLQKGILTQTKFDFLQTCVNVRVKGNFEFKFIEIPLQEALELKEFAITTLKPKMNIGFHK